MYKFNNSYAESEFQKLLGTIQVKELDENQFKKIFGEWDKFDSGPLSIMEAARQIFKSLKIVLLRFTEDSQISIFNGLESLGRIPLTEKVKIFYDFTKRYGIVGYVYCYHITICRDNDNSAIIERVYRPLMNILERSLTIEIGYEFKIQLIEDDRLVIREGGK